MKKSKNINFLLLLLVLFLLSLLEMSGILAALWMVAIVCVLWILVRKENVFIPPVAFVAVAYISSFSMPILLPDLYPKLWIQIPRQSLEFGMLWAVRGFGAFAVGYALLMVSTRSSQKRYLQKNNTATNQNQNYTTYLLKSIGWLSLLAWLTSTVFFGISLVFIEGNTITVSSGQGTLVQISTLLLGLRYPFFLVFLINYHKYKSNKQLSFLCLSLLLISLFEILIIGSKGAIIRLLLMSLMAQSFLRIKLNTKQLTKITLICILTYGSFSVITEYRAIMQHNARYRSDASSIETQVTAFKSAFFLSLPFSQTLETRRTTVDSKTALNRFGSGMHSFANLLRFTRQHPPYEHALESFLTPAYSFIPRFLLPEKPTFFSSGDNAKKYYGWSYGGISVTLLGSFYYAWGYSGIIFSMFFLGISFSYVIRKSYSSHKLSVHYLIILVTFLLNLMDTGITFQSISTNITRILFLLWTLHFLYPLIQRTTQRVHNKTFTQTHGKYR